MSWNPNWEIMKVSGRDVCYDRKSGLYLCPLCVPQCLKVNLLIPKKEASYFLTKEDLLIHIQLHETGELKKVFAPPIQKEETSDLFY